MKTLNVIAPEGKICPMEGGRRVGIITGKKAVTVPSTAYYRRMMKEESLLDPAKKKTAAGKTAETATASKGSK